MMVYRWVVGQNEGIVAGAPSGRRQEGGPLPRWTLETYPIAVLHRYHQPCFVPVWPIGVEEIKRAINAQVHYSGCLITCQGPPESILPPLAMHAGRRAGTSRHDPGAWLPLAWRLQRPPGGSQSAGGRSRYLTTNEKSARIYINQAASILF